jgi:formylglycine-generating enzyme
MMRCILANTFNGIVSLLLLISCNKQPTFLVISPTISAFSDSISAKLTIIDTDTIWVTPPENMVFVKGGIAYVGSDSSGLVAENPRFWIHVRPFFMDVSPVTVAEFREFVNATGYATQAEKFGDGAYIGKSSHYKWVLKKGCTWHHPQGIENEAAPDNHPVTQVSWDDAEAYARWANKRLPHELEFEYAVRNARNDQTLYSFGNNLKTAEGTWKTNILQGVFPVNNTKEDGYLYTSPVGVFGTTPLGLTDLTGNVWQWCSNEKFSYSDVVKALETNSKVPILSNEKAQRGGSFLCEESWCHGYRASGRSFTSPETSLMHVGFRCVKDITVNK